MLNRMWLIPPWIKRYVTGCQIAKRSKKSAGRKPKFSVRVGTRAVRKKTAKFNPISILITGVIGPGPKEYEEVDLVG
jgi:hypothetical protein